jgi:hypothetical protein
VGSARPLTLKGSFPRYVNIIPEKRKSMAFKKRHAPTYAIEGTTMNLQT